MAIATQLDRRRSAQTVERKGFTNQMIAWSYQQMKENAKRDGSQSSRE
jgi:hypothetical protein